MIPPRETRDYKREREAERKVERRPLTRRRASEADAAGDLSPQERGEVGRGPRERSATRWELRQEKAKDNTSPRSCGERSPPSRASRRAAGEGPPTRFSTQAHFRRGSLLRRQRWPECLREGVGLAQEAQVGRVRAVHGALAVVADELVAREVDAGSCRRAATSASNAFFSAARLSAFRFADGQAGPERSRTFGPRPAGSAWSVSPCAAPSRTARCARPPAPRSGSAGSRARTRPHRARPAARRCPASSVPLPEKPRLMTGRSSLRPRIAVWTMPGRDAHPPCVIDVP